MIFHSFYTDFIIKTSNLVSGYLLKKNIIPINQHHIHNNSFLLNASFSTFLPNTHMMRWWNTPKLGQYISPTDTKDVIKKDATAPTFHMQLIFNINVLGVFNNYFTTHFYDWGTSRMVSLDTKTFQSSK